MKLNKEQLARTSLKLTLLTSAFLYINLNSVNRKTTKSLYERANGTCEHPNCNNTKNLEIAHIQHGKTKKHNKLRNLKLYCICCHFKDHKKRSRNNLSKAENRFALYSIWHRMTTKERKGIPEPKRPKKNNKSLFQLNNEPVNDDK